MDDLDKIWSEKFAIEELVHHCLEEKIDVATLEVRLKEIQDTTKYDEVRAFAVSALASAKAAMDDELWGDEWWGED